MDGKQSSCVAITVRGSPGAPKKPMSLVRVIHWAATLCIIACLVASLVVDKMRKTTISGLEFWKWTLLAMVVLSGLLFTNCLMEFIICMIKGNSYWKKKLLQPIYSFKNGVQMLIWIAGVLLVWVCLFTDGVRRPKISTEIVKLVTRTLIVLLVGSVMWLFKTFWIKIYAARFLSGEYIGEHLNPFFHQDILKTLSGPPPADPHNVEVPRKEKFLAGVMTGTSYFLFVSNLGDESVHDNQTETRDRAAKAAERLFSDGAGGSKQYISKGDLLNYMAEDKADIVFPLFEESETGKIDRKSFDNWVEKIIGERKEIMRALYEANAPVRQLNTIISGLLVILCTIIWLLVMDLTNLQTLSLLLTAIGFAFSNTCKTIVEAAIFVLAVRPFLVGDRCVVEGNALLVKEMGIFTTVFLNAENEKVYYPNSLLSEKNIRNCDRGRKVCIVEFEIDSATPGEKIDLLKDDIKRSVEKNRGHWLPKHEIKVEKAEKESQLKVTLYCYHTMNSQNFLKKNQRKSKLILEMKKIFQKHNVQFSLTPRRNRLSLSELQIFAEKENHKSN